MALQTMRGAAPYGGLHEVEHGEDPLSRRDWRGEGLEPGPKVATGQDGPQANGSWLPPIVKTVATIGEGVEALRGRIEEHRTYLHASGSYAERETARAASILDQVLCQQLKAALTARLPDEQLTRLVAAVANRELDPYRAAQQLLALHLQE
jgi:putative protein kinase ArgK-like GTPase of G3E family